MSRRKKRLGGPKRGYPHAKKLNGGRVSLTCHTTTELKDRAQKAAQKERISDSAWLERAVRYVLGKRIRLR